MRDLTDRQREVLSFIDDFIHHNGYSPTIRQIAEHFSISIKGAHDHVSALKKKGALIQEEKMSRTLKPAAPSRADGFTEIPILGAVAAGKPILSEENRDGSLTIHPSFLKKKRNYFALRVRGDSMEGAGILDGDYAVIEQQPVVRNGEIAVIMLEDAVTLKTFYKENARVRLQPANPSYQPIYCNRDVQVLGRLAHIIRSYG